MRASCLQLYIYFLGPCWSAILSPDAFSRIIVLATGSLLTACFACYIFAVVCVGHNSSFSSYVAYLVVVVSFFSFPLSLHQTV